MEKPFKIAIYFSLVLFLCCKAVKQASDKTLEEPKNISNVIIDPEFSPEEKNIQAQIIGLSKISNGIIELIFSYSGGCKEHEFYLITKGGLIKTIPPQIKLFLVNQQEDDPCRMLITDTLKFNIAAILPEKSDSVIVSVNNRFLKTVLR
jgi:hypothetical protein